MRLVTKKTVREFYAVHAEAAPSLRGWMSTILAGSWSTTSAVQASFPKAKVLDAERIRFRICGNAYRLVASFDFERSQVFIKFIGTHAEYDRIDALSVDLYGR